MKLWEINEMMKGDKLFKVSDEESVNMETGEVFDKEYLDSLPLAQEEKTKNIGLVIKDYEADIEQINTELKRLMAMRKSCERKIESLKSYILAFGCPVKDIAVTIKFNKGRDAVEVADGVDLPDVYKKYKWELDKKAIKEALDKGEEIEGCRIVRKPSITVK